MERKRKKKKEITENINRFIQLNYSLFACWNSTGIGAPVNFDTTAINSYYYSGDDHTWLT